MARLTVPKRITDLPKPYHSAAMRAAGDENDRGCAIIGTAFLDLQLRAALEHEMRNDRDLINALFNGGGALQSFANRIHIAYAFKTIGGAAYNDLHIMRQIRNAFAHSAEQLSFHDKNVSQLCDQLWFAQHIHMQKRPDPTTARDRFLRGVDLLGQGLFEVTHPQLSRSRFIHYGPQRKGAPPT